MPQDINEIIDGNKGDLASKFFENPELVEVKHLRAKSYETVAKEIQDVWGHFISLNIKDGEVNLSGAMVDLHTWATTDTDKLEKRIADKLEKERPSAELKEYFKTQDELMFQLEDAVLGEKFRDRTSKAQAAMFNQRLAMALWSIRNLPVNDPVRLGYNRFANLALKLARENHPYGNAINALVSGAIAHSAVLEQFAKEGYKIAVPNVVLSDTDDVEEMDVIACTDVAMVKKTKEGTYIYLVDVKSGVSLEKVSVKHFELNGEGPQKTRQKVIEGIKEIFQLGDNVEVFHVTMNVPSGPDFIDREGGANEGLILQMEAALEMGRGKSI